MRRYLALAVAPRDAASGLPTGKRQHEPFSILKPADAASGGLLGAMLDAAPIDTVTVTSFRRKRGRWTPYRVIRLHDAYVGAIGERPGPTDARGDERYVDEVAFLLPNDRVVVQRRR